MEGQWLIAVKYQVDRNSPTLWYNEITLKPTRRHNTSYFALEFGGLLKNIFSPEVLPFRHKVSSAFTLKPPLIQEDGKQ